MKICKIVDEYRNDLLTGYLFYYEKSDAYTIELSSDLTEEDAPIFFEGFIRRGIYTVDQKFSRRWVESRVVPRDRQNLGAILKDNGLKEYDTFRLLMLAEGRCAQDDCAVFPVKGSRLPEWLTERRRRTLTFAAALAPWDMILIYADESIRRTDAKKLLGRKRQTEYILARPDKHKDLHIMPGGAGVEWSDGVFLTADELYEEGTVLPLSRDELDAVVGSYIVDTSEICYELDCSRQYVSKLVREHGIEEFKAVGGTRLFTRAEADRLKDI